MTNYPSGLSRRDMDYIEGYDDTTQADIDDFNGAQWMKSLAVREHDAIPMSVNPAGTVFRASCGCAWYARSHYGTFAKAHAQIDANAHNAEHAK